MNLDYEAIKNLVEVSQKCELSELVIEYEGIKIEIKRNPKKDVTPFNIPPKIISEPESVVSHVLHREQVNNSADTVVIEEKPSEPENDYLKVISPLVGVFYRAPWPGAKSFVEIGDRVSVGQTLCIVEAMKLMNEITAEVSGTVGKILAKNEQVVQTGETLFLIKPD